MAKAYRGREESGGLLPARERRVLKSMSKLVQQSDY